MACSSWKPKTTDTRFPSFTTFGSRMRRGETLIRFYFPNPWLDSEEKPTEFQPEKLAFFQEFRSRYVGRGGIVHVQRPRQEGAPPSGERSLSPLN